MQQMWGVVSFSASFLATTPDGMLHSIILSVDEVVAKPGETTKFNSDKYGTAKVGLKGMTVTPGSEWVNVGIFPASEGNASTRKATVSAKVNYTKKFEVAQKDVGTVKIANLSTFTDDRKTIQYSFTIVNNCPDKMTFKGFVMVSNGMVVKRVPFKETIDGGGKTPIKGEIDMGTVREGMSVSVSLEGNSEEAKIFIK